ncbi:VCBS repeat-containing protein, partial [Pirellulales bacterium]|nr:VCBS repeat-containing protein [Pirellulales bacterium]
MKRAVAKVAFLCVAIVFPVGCQRQDNGQLSSNSATRGSAQDSETEGASQEEPHLARESPSSPLEVPDVGREVRQRGSQQLAASDGPLLVEVTEELGIEVSNQAWPDGKYFTPEIIPGGVALLDYDNDGDLDIYHIRHAPCGDPPEPFAGKAPNRLYRQESDGKFAAVPGAAGMDDPGYGHGAAVGDIDNDGDLDVFVTNYGTNVLYKNNADGTFEDVTAEAGIAGNRWSSAASFFDLEGDGDLDLYVVNFAS